MVSHFSTSMDEIFLPFRHPQGQAPSVSRVRSTLISASLQMIRQFGWEERYMCCLAADYLKVIPSLVAGTWIPTSMAMAHYRACDAMSLSPAEVVRIGAAVSAKTRQLFVNTMRSMAIGAGATPWVFFQNHHRLWTRMFDGGDQCVHRVGPKDAISHIVQLPLLQVPYFRVAIRTYYQVLVQLFTNTVVVREVPAYVGHHATGLRFAWV